MTRYLPLLIALAIIPACDNDEDKAAKDKAAEAEKAKKPKKGKKAKNSKKGKKKGPKLAALAPENPATELGDVPVFEDLEEEAERTVAIENLESELDRLEAEIVGVE